MNSKEEKKALFCTGQQRLEWQNYVEPELGSGQIRVQSNYSVAKHGTEMAFFKGYEPARGSWNAQTQMFEPKNATDFYPGRVGNMFVGPVVEVHPDVNEFGLGDMVFGHGGFSTTHTVFASRCRKLTEGLSWESAVCLDPAEFALGAVRDAKLRVGDNVAIFGLGAIGLLVVQMAKLAGCRSIIGIDPLPNRREIGIHLGADDVLNPLELDIGAKIRGLTGGRGADVCVEYSGSRQGLQQALRGVAYGGTVVAGAYPGPYEAGLDLGAEAHFNRPDLIFSRACSSPDREHPRWDNQRILDTCYEMITQGRISGDRIVTPVVKFDDLLEEYPKILSHPDTYVKLGVKHK